VLFVFNEKLRNIVIHCVLLGALLAIYPYTSHAQIAWLLLLVVLNGVVSISNFSVPIRYMVLSLSVLIGLYLQIEKLNILPNIIWLENVKTATHAPFFNIGLNGDKLFMALAYLPLIPMIRLHPRQVAAAGLIFITFLYLMVTSSTLVTAGLFFDYIRFDFTLPTFIPIWAFNMLIVCAYEEVFFRGVLQNALMKCLPRYSWVAILVASILFGYAHHQMGWTMVGLSAISGVFYGSLYKLSRTLWCPIILHFATNSIHFLFFSYPRLGA